ncbi:unnamed protein product [Echinostoma caproni]|uniref:C2H2-type domain-containing protein n=1 Tax=Echinostoma caproni TaxID=27848 RepID=A0A3P8H9V3_9TREM|nr:unnamed protein product [Echinostoma caproni]
MCISLPFSDATQNIQHWLPRRRGLPFRCGPHSRACLRKRDRFQTVSSRVYQRIPIRLKPSAVCQTQVLQRRHRRRFESITSTTSRSGGPMLAFKTQIRLLTLQRPSLVHKNHVYRCPLCPRNCRTLNRLRHHLTTCHADTLASAIQQNTDVLVSPPSSTNPPDVLPTPTTITTADASLRPTGPSLRTDLATGTTTVSQPKPALFLLHVEGTVDPKSIDSNVRLNGDTRSSEQTESALCCEFCGRTFQKLKFFEDHRVMCKQAIHERERRQRLRLHRQMGFRDTDEFIPSSTETTLSVPIFSSWTSSTEAPRELADSDRSDTNQITPGLRRSQRVRTSRVLLTGTKHRTRRKKQTEQQYTSECAAREVAVPLLTARASPALTFELIAECPTSRARRAQLWLPHCPGGPVETPVFMPVGTQGAMKGVTVAQLEALDCRILLGNTYHLGHRPGPEIMRKVSTSNCISSHYVHALRKISFLIILGKI